MPVLGVIFGVPVPSYHVLFLLAAVLGYGFAHHLTRVFGDDAFRRALPLVFPVVYFAGWIGARGLGVLTEEPTVGSVGEFLAALTSLGPMTFYGGALAGGMAAAIGLRLCGVSLARGFDVGIPATILGLGIGRLGCFLNGCDYGRPTISGWWSHASPVLQDGVSRYPTQLEESAFSLLVAFGVAVFAGQRRWMFTPGTLGLTALAASATHRFLNEMFRGDERGSFFATALSTSQGIALVLAVGSLVALLVPAARKS